MKRKDVRKILDIPEMPTDNVPDLKVVSPFKKIQEVRIMVR
jgi:hypothetical protein